MLLCYTTGALVFLIAELWSSAESRGAVQTMDVLEKENVLLECRFNPGLAHRARTLYWIRTNRRGTDNVAIGQSPLEEHYSVDSRVDSGIYDLRIQNATYDRDNGKFECRIKEAGTSFMELHSKSVELTVLLKPSPPKISLSSLVPITEGVQLNLTCSSLGGSPTPQINWYKEGDSQSLEAIHQKGKNKDKPSVSVLTITPTKSDDQTSYFCSVWNRALGQSQKLTASQKLNVNYFPRVFVGPANPFKVIKGESARLTCRVDSKPPVHKVRWIKDEQILSTSFEYEIHRTNPQHSGSYYCLADNGLGRAIRTELTLNVLYPPIVNVPESKVLDRNDDALIDCSVRANPPAIKIEWFKENDSSFRQRGSKLKIRGATAFDAGAYLCSVTNHLDPSSILPDKILRTSNATIHIHVRHRPGNSIIMPRNPIGVVDRTLTLRCEANPPGYPLPRYKWWKGDSRRNSSGSSIFGGQEFTIHKVLLSHEGRYCCQSHNQLGEGSFSCIFVQVYEAPKMVARLQPSIIKREGELDFQISCGAIGKPKPLLRWYKNSRLIHDSESKSYQIYTSEQPIDAGRGTNVYSVLKFVGPKRKTANKLIASDRGRYVCRFENEIDRVESSTLIKVQHTPMVINKFNKIGINLGQTALIGCSVRAFPTPRIEWSFRDRYLKEGAHEIGMTSIGALNEDEYTGYLKIPNVAPSDYGDYSCNAINSMGSKREIIRLQKKSRPDSPISLKILDVSYNSVKVTWVEGFNGGFNDTLYIIQYKKHDEISLLRYKKCISENPCNVSNLYQNTRYYFKVKAVNMMGESNFTKEVTTVTKTNISLIPRPAKVHFEKSHGILSFRSSEFPLRLVAQVETEATDGTWKQYTEINLGSENYGNVEVKDPDNIRVRYCLKSNPLICGPYEEALVVDNAATTTTTSSSTSPQEMWIVFVSFILLVLVMGMVILVLKCYYFINGRIVYKASGRVAGGTPINNNVTFRRPDGTSSSAYTMSSSSFGIHNKDGSIDSREVEDDSFYDEKKNNLNNEGSSSTLPRKNNHSSLWNIRSSFYHQQKKELNESLQQCPSSRYATLNRPNNASSYFPFNDDLGRDIFGERGNDYINNSIRGVDKRSGPSQKKTPANATHNHPALKIPSETELENESFSSTVASKTRRIIREIIV